MKSPLGMQTAADWDSTWNHWFHKYAIGFPRLGVWLEAEFPPDGLDVLEIGAGSARESRYIARRARTVTCTDFSPAVVALVKASHLPRNMSVHVMDAFSLDFPDKSFDISFHKGFWSYFSDDRDIIRLFKEQVRVTKTIALALVHNARNRSMVREFARKSQDDNLFRVRFFDPPHLKVLLESQLAADGIAGRVRVRKFGGMNWLFKWSCPLFLQPARTRMGNLLYPALPWSRVESVVLEVRLDRQQ